MNVALIKTICKIPKKPVKVSLEQQFAGKKHYSSDFECKYVFQGGLAFCQYKELKNNPCPVYFALVEKYGKTYLEPNSILEIEFGSLAISQS